MEPFVVGSILGLAGWWWLLRHSARTGGLRAPAGDWHGPDAVFAGIIGFYFLLIILAGGGAERVITSADVLGALIYYSIFTLLVVWVVVARGRSLPAIFGLVPAQPFKVVAIAIACIVCIYPVLELIGMFAIKLGRPVTDGDEMVRYFRSGLSPSDLTWAIVVVVIAAPLFEELIFRGFLYGVVKRYVGTMWACLTTALLFAALHQNLPAIPVYFLLGVALVLAYEITGSLWASTVMHMLFNSVTVVVILWFPEWIH